MAERKQFIDDDQRVYCPKRHLDVDVESCLACRRLKDVRLEGTTQVIVCAIDQGMPPELRDVTA